MNRRHFIQSLGAVAVPALASPAVASPPPAALYDIVIKNGEVRDPGRGIQEKADVAVKDGKIVAIEPGIAAERALDVVDASGKWVVPGLVDLHTHIHYGLGIGIKADPLAARSGTTTWVDAGTFAYNETRGFREFIVEPAQARIYGFIHLYPNNRNPAADAVRHVRRAMHPTGKAAVANRDIILGVKFQVGSNMNGQYSLDFLKTARELCDTYKLTLMAHISFSPPSTDQVMDLMRPGDIVTHCYNTHGIGILDENGKIKSSVTGARQRGVLFDIGHGAGSFNFGIARKALDQGFLPDSISTDVYTRNINGPVYDMPTTMSKMLALGMSLDDVLLRSTANPAKVVNRLEGIGGLSVGGPADIAVLEMHQGSFQLVDSQKNTVPVQEKLVSRLTICRGKRLIASL